MSHSGKPLLVHEIHDMWPETLMELGAMSPRHPFVSLIRISADRAYSTSDRVVSLLPNTRDYLIERGMSPSAFVHVPNGVCLEEWTLSEIPLQHHEVLQQLVDQGTFVIGYFGGHALSNALDILLDSAKLTKCVPVTYVLVGDGDQKSKLMARATQEEITNVIFLPPVPKRSIPSLLSMFNCAYIGAAYSVLYRFGISFNKLFDAMMSGLPIICAVPAVTPVSEVGCGISVPSCDPQDLAQAVRDMIAMPLEDRVVMGQRGQHAVTTQYDYATLARQFLTEILG